MGNGNEGVSVIAAPKATPPVISVSESPAPALAAVQRPAEQASALKPAHRKVRQVLGLVETGEELKYGENPGLFARALSFVRNAGSPWKLKVLKGSRNPNGTVSDKLGYNNFIDINNGYLIVSEFKTPAAAIMKHGIPCGIATGPTIKQALRAALEGDPEARYGCVITINVPMTDDAMDMLKGVFVDMLVGPEFTKSQLKTWEEKRPKMKVVKGDIKAAEKQKWSFKGLAGRLMQQEVDRRKLDFTKLRLETGNEAREDDFDIMEFAFVAVKHARSNAIVLAKGVDNCIATVGIGAGQTSRVRAVRCALEVAGERAKHSIVLSDAYFPKPDGVELLGKAGVKMIVQPGGSMRDHSLYETYPDGSKKLDINQRPIAKEMGAIETAAEYGVTMYTGSLRAMSH